MLLADKFQRQFELALQVIESSARYEKSPWLTHLLKASRDVDAIAQQIILVDNHISEIDAHAEEKSTLDWDIHLARSDLTL